jgi:RNA methyltransferase, TrmH family
MPSGFSPRHDAFAARDIARNTLAAVEPLLTGERHPMPPPATPQPADPRSGPERITSPANPRIKAARRLRGADERRSRGLTLVDGIREIERAVAAGVPCEELFLLEGSPPAAGDLPGRLAATGTRVSLLGPAAFGRIAFGDRNEGLVAVVRMQPPSLAAFTPRPGRPLLVLEGLEKPGNLGAILRTADAAGLGGVIVADGRTDPTNPAAIRASLGTLFAVPLAVADGEATIDWLASRGRRLTAAVPAGGLAWHEADLRDESAILLGSEAGGLSGRWQAAADAGRIPMQTISLPMLGVADSLNVSAAAAVLAYESLRQQTAG